MFAQSFFISLIINAFIYVLFGFYFETGSEVYAQIIHNGDIIGKPDSLLNNYGVYVLITHAFKGLYSVFNGVEWFSIFLFLIITFILTNAIYFIRKEVKINFLPTRLLFWMILILSLESLIMVESIRLSFLMVSTSMLVLYSINSNNDKSILKYLYLYFLIFIGLCIRIESGLLAFVFMLMPMVIMNMGVKKVLKLFTPVFAFILFLSLFLNYSFNDSDRQYSEVRPYQFVLWDFSPEYYPDNLSDKRDSVVFKTAKQFFFADTENINPEFFERVGVNKADKTPAGIFGLIQHADIYKLKRYFNMNSGFLLLYLASLFIIYIIIFIYNSNKKLILLSLFYTLATVLALSLLMKMEHRLLQSIVLSSLILLLYKLNILSNWNVSIKLKYQSFFLSFLLISFACLTFVRIQNYYKERRQMIQNIEDIKNIATNEVQKSYLQLDLVSLINWDVKMNFLRKGKSTFSENLIVLDNFILFCHQSQKDRLIDNFGDARFGSFYLNHAQNSKFYYLISSHERKMLMQNYVYELYDVEQSFEVVFQPEDAVNPLGMALYKVYSKKI